MILRREVHKYYERENSDNLLMLYGEFPNEFSQYIEVTVHDDTDIKCKIEKGANVEIDVFNDLENDTLHALEIREQKKKAV